MSALNPAPKPQRRRGTSDISTDTQPAVSVPMEEPVSELVVDVGIPAFSEPHAADESDRMSTTKRSLRDVHADFESATEWLTPNTTQHLTATAWASSETPAPPATPPVGFETLAARTRKRRILLAGVYAVVGLLVVNAIVGVFSRGPSTDKVAQQVATSVASDGSLAAVIGTGEQFLRAYYNINPSSETNRRAVLDGLSGGNGYGWVGAGKDAKPQTVVLGPTLAYPPTPSRTYPGALTAGYTVWVSTDGAEPTQLLVSVPIQVTENGRGVVVAPPAVLPLPNVEAPAVAEVEADTQLGQAATANLEQFLKAWSQASPNTTGEVSTQLQAFMAPDASVNTRSGLGGAVALVNVSDVRLAPIDESGTSITGTVLVRWVSPAGVQMQQNYSVDMVNIAGKWLVSRIGAL